MAAHTGVAASNDGCGGRTLDGLFRTTGETVDELKGSQLRDLKSELAECRILVIDEISTVGPQQLAAVSERPRQCDGPVPSFGGVGVVFSGDSAQLPPIGQRSPIYNAKSGKSGGGEKSAAAARLGAAGRRRFAEVNSCVRLRVIYRQGTRARSRSRPRVSGTAP